jgi:TfoX/Sxy family transcriptional regulator of competence genes
MAVNEKILNRVREALAEQGDVEEKKMFRGICFMVNGKMCVCVNDEEMLCRIGPDAYEAALEQPGVVEMVMKGKLMKDYVFVSNEVIKTTKQLQYWVNLALSFNKDAKASKKKPARKVRG